MTDSSLLGPRVQVLWRSADGSEPVAGGSGSRTIGAAPHSLLRSIVDVRLSTAPVQASRLRQYEAGGSEAVLPAGVRI